MSEIADQLDDALAAGDDAFRTVIVHVLTTDPRDGSDTGGLRVPCSRWGRTGRDCAEVVVELARIFAEANGDVGDLDYLMGLVVNDHPDAASLIREHGSAEALARWAEELAEDDPAVTAAEEAARVLGAEAALAAASWLILDSEADALSILDDVDPAVLDRYPEPNLSGEMAGDPTPASLAVELLGVDNVGRYAGVVEDRLADAWEDGRDRVWSGALEAHALRLLGRVEQARQLEAAGEACLAALRAGQEVGADA